MAFETDPEWQSLQRRHEQLTTNKKALAVAIGAIKPYWLARDLTVLPGAPPVAQSDAAEALMRLSLAARTVDSELLIVAQQMQAIEDKLEDVTPAYLLEMVRVAPPPIVPVATVATIS